MVVICLKMMMAALSSWFPYYFNNHESLIAKIFRNIIYACLTSLLAFYYIKTPPHMADRKYINIVYLHTTYIYIYIYGIISKKI